MTPPARRRYPIRYAIQRWRDLSWFYGGLLVATLVLIAVKPLVHQPEDPWIFAAAIICAVFLIGLWLMRVFSYVEVADDRLRVRYVTRRLELPYSRLSRVRRQPLEVAFQPAERRRFVNGFVRRLAKQPAAYIRLDRRQDGIVEEAERRLGPRFVTGADVVVPLLGLDDFVAEMKGRLRGQPGA